MMFSRRTSDVVEPLIKEQWYVKCDDMVDFALEVRFVMSCSWAQFY